MDTFIITNQESVIRHFGSWPSFHDAEIISVVFERGMPGYWPLICLKIEIVGGCLLELEFQDVHDYELAGFNCQNVIFDIRFTEENNLIFCGIDTSYGLDGSITAQRIAVKGFSPLDTNGSRD